MLETQTLTHEFQLGNSLNKSVQQTRRADFALMLAMLTDDVREHSQFLVPETELSEDEVTTELLRKEFELPKAQPLGIDSTASLDKYNQAELVNSKLQASIRLNDALTPLPIAFRDKAKHIPTVVLANTSIHCQERALNTTKQEKLSMNAKEWLNAVKSTLTLSEINTSQYQAA